MKNLFAQAIAQVDAAHAAQPISGNEKELSAIFTKIYQRSEQQGFGLAQLLTTASFIKAANSQHGEINEIIIAVRTELESASCRFDSETKQFLQNALAKGPDELVKVLQQAVPAKATAPAEAEPETFVVESTEVSATAEEALVTVVESPVPDVADKGIHLVVDQEELPPKVFEGEEELKKLLSEIRWLPILLPEGDYSLAEHLDPKLDCILEKFHLRNVKDRREQRALALLNEYKCFIDGEQGIQKVGGKSDFSKKAAEKCSFFLFFKIYML